VSHRIARTRVALILTIVDLRIINAADDRHAGSVCAGLVATRRPDHRVLIAVRPGLLGDLLARRFDPDEVEVVLLQDADLSPSLSPASARHFDVVVATGIPPAHVEADTVLRLPDRLGHGVASLVTGHQLQRVRIDGPGDVVDVVSRVLAGSAHGGA
jgi:hypothetical protein